MTQLNRIKDKNGIDKIRNILGNLFGNGFSQHNHRQRKWVDTGYSIEQSILIFIYYFVIVFVAATVSRFAFTYPIDPEDSDGLVDERRIDDDGDVIVKRKRRDAIEIEHRKSTDLKLVGLQVWRGALILADFLFHNRHEFAQRNILEMGSGVGLSSIAAAIHSRRNVCCTDIDIGGILRVIESNALRNKRLMATSSVNVMAMDFSNRKWTDELQQHVRDAEVVLAADGE